MAVRKKADAPTLFDLGSMLKDNLNRASTRPSVHNYVPHAKQTDFHSSQAQGRLYIGGNRAGKTVGGIVEDIWWLKGQHPHRRVPTQCKGRIVTVSYTEGIEKIIMPELARWLPPSDLINGSWTDSYNGRTRTLTLTNGSYVELMSYDQKLEKFSGTSRHFIHFDEEPPEDIFTECKMRLMDTGGSWWVTMTPVDGMTWVYDKLFVPALAGTTNINLTIVDTEENPHLSGAEIETALSGLTVDEKKARKEGKFVQLGGVAFPNFTEKHVVAELERDGLDKISGWTHYVSMDHGLNNPTCWLWHAVAPSGAVITYDELYDNERLIDTYAAEVLSRNNQDYRRHPDLYVGDPAIRQRSAQTGDSVQVAYQKAGIPLVLGNGGPGSVAIGVEKMNRFLKNGMWVITSNCHNLTRQLSRVRWEIYENAKKRNDNNLREQLHKKDDHATDAARYFFSLLPDLYLPPSGSKDPDPHDVIKGILTPTNPMYRRNARYDPNLGRGATMWRDIDENMGSEY